MKRIYLLAPVVLSAVVFGVVIATSADATPQLGSSPNSAPPFGPPDLTGANAPAYIPAGGPDGGPVICPNGKELMVPTATFHGPPPKALAGVPMAYAARRGEDYVFRCGTGKNAHLSPSVVPSSQDPLLGTPDS